MLRLEVVASRKRRLGSFRKPSAAPGFRDCGYYGRGGQPDNVGYGGFSWSPAVGGTNRIYGTFLSFYTQRINPNSSGYRAHGVQLRCLSE